MAGEIAIRPAGTGYVEAGNVQHAEDVGQQVIEQLQKAMEVASIPGVEVISAWPGGFVRAQETEGSLYLPGTPGSPAVLACTPTRAGWRGRNTPHLTGLRLREDPPARGPFTVVDVNGAPMPDVVLTLDGTGVALSDPAGRVELPCLGRTGLVGHGRGRPIDFEVEDGVIREVPSTSDLHSLGLRVSPYGAPLTTWEAGAPAVRSLQPGLWRCTLGAAPPDATCEPYTERVDVVDPTGRPRWSPGFRSLDWPRPWGDESPLQGRPGWKQDERWVWADPAFRDAPYPASDPVLPEGFDPAAAIVGSWQGPGDAVIAVTATTMDGEPVTVVGEAGGIALQWGASRRSFVFADPDTAVVTGALPRPGLYRRLPPPR